MVESFVPDRIRRGILTRARLVRGQNPWAQRMRWAAVDKDNLQELVNKVSQFIGELERFHDGLVRDDMAQVLARLLSTSIRRCSTPVEAHTLQSAIEMFDGGSGKQHSLRGLAELRGAVLAYPDLSNDSSWEVTDQILDFGKVADFSNFGGGDALAAGKYDGEEVFLEFRTIHPEGRRHIIQRAKSLALFLIAYKPQVFRTLTCRGVAVAPDDSKLFFVFDLPRSGSHPVALHSPLSSKKGSLPSVESRLKLAERLIEALRFVLISGWLHRNIRNENILFFTKNADLDSFELTVDTTPFMAGFAFARMDASKYSEARTLDPKQDMYRHPTWLKADIPRAEPFMDVYSLGLILVELAAWEPLADIVQRQINVNRSDVTRADVQTVREHVRERSSKKKNGLYLPYRMGSIHASCVDNFLAIERGETEQALDVLQSAAESLRQCSM